MTEINTNNNSLQIGQTRDPLSVSNVPSNQAIAPTSDATAYGAPVNIAAQKASVFNDCEIPEETLNLLRSANENPNFQGLQNFFKATGFKRSYMAQIAAKPALGVEHSPTRFYSKNRHPSRSQNTCNTSQAA
jgi:hypothetical protein